MLNKISWSSFGSLVALIIIVYYLYVLITFYRKEIFSFASIKNPAVIKSRKKNVSKEPEKQNQDSSNESDKAGDESFSVVHELLEDLKKLFIHAAITKIAKEELIQAIHSKLTVYPGIAEKDLVEDINTHIILEANEKCGLELLPEDLKQIWN